MRTPGDSFICPKTSAVFLQHTALVHFVPEVIALTAALADAGEDGIAAVLRCDVVNEFLNEHRFADACAAEQTNLCRPLDTAPAGR